MLNPINFDIIKWTKLKITSTINNNANNNNVSTQKFNFQLQLNFDNQLFYEINDVP